MFWEKHKELIAFLGVIATIASLGVAIHTGYFRQDTRKVADFENPKLLPNGVISTSESIKPEKAAIITKLPLSSPKASLNSNWNNPKLSCNISFEGRTDSATTVNPKGDIAVHGDRKGIIKIWDLRKCTLQKELMDNQGSIVAVAISPDGKRLASSSSASKAIRIWDVSTGEEEIELAGHSNLVFGLKFSSDSKFIASGSKDGTIKIWNLQNKQEILVSSVHSLPIRFLKFSFDSQSLISYSADDLLDTRVGVIWDLKNDKIVRNCSQNTCPYLYKEVISTSNPQGKSIFIEAIGKKVNFLNSATGDKIRVLGGWFSDRVCSISISPDRNYLAIGECFSGKIKIWNLSTTKITQTIDTHSKSSIKALAFNPSNRIIVSASDNGVKRSVKILNLDSGNAIKSLSQEGGSTVTGIHFTPDAKFIVLRSHELFHREKVKISVWQGNN